MTSTAAWDVDGERVTFRSETALLHDRPEAIGSAFLLPAAWARADLELSDPLDPVWRAGAGEAAALARRWWGWRRPALVASLGSSGRRGSGTALCFTGGIDSFHALLCGSDRPTELLYVSGYDIAIDDRIRLAGLLPRLRSVAEACSLPLRVVDTDLRQHPAFAGVSWERTHGGALAAAGHLLDVGALLISASAATGRDRPWGSHPQLDGLWSSSRMQVRHVDFGPTRFEKAVEVAHHPLVRAHLQVCWRQQGSPGNCGRCFKCVVTMAALDAVGALEGSAVLPGPADLAARIDALPTGTYPDTLRATRRATARPDVTAALDRLITRIPRRPPPAQAWGRWQVGKARVHGARRALRSRHRLVSIRRPTVG